MEEISAEGPLAVMGDFNAAPEEDDVHDPEALNGRMCFHPEERKRLLRILSLGMTGG